VLDHKERMAVMEHFAEEQTHAEIAQIISCEGMTLEQAYERNEDFWVTTTAIIRLPKREIKDAFDKAVELIRLRQEHH